MTNPESRVPNPVANRVPHWAAAVCDGVHAAGSRDVVYVPDNPLSHVLHDFERRYADVRLLLATREEEAFGIAAGLYVGGKLPTVMLQSSGLGNSLNALTSLLLPYQIPVLMIVSMRGDLGEWNSAQVPMGRAVRPILDSLGIPHVTAAAADSVAQTIRLTGVTAFGTRRLGACLLPRRLTTSGQGSDTVPDGGSDTVPDPGSDTVSDTGSDTGSDTVPDTQCPTRRKCDDQG